MSSPRGLGPVSALVTPEGDTDVLPERSRFGAVFRAGRVAVVTGSSSGIGRSVARRCARFGMHVFLADKDGPALERARDEVHAIAQQHGGSATAVLTDVSDLASVQALKRRVLATHKTVHLLHNNAGTGTGGGALAGPVKWERTLGVNLWGVIHGCQELVPAMLDAGEPGMVINTGSKQGITMPPGNLAYNTSKAALKAYTEGLCV